MIDKTLALDLLDEIDRARRISSALAETNGWHVDWQNRAVAEMHAVLDADEGGQPLPANVRQALDALIAEWWDDGEDDASESGQ